MSDLEPKPEAENTWSRVLGPVYSQAAIEAAGLEGLAIPFTTSDGGVVYPHRQFDIGEDGGIKLRVQVVEVWNDVVKPHIDSRHIDVWSASGVMFQNGSEHRVPRADSIADHWHSSQELEEVKRQLAKNISGWG
jgi:hypothetical protein